MASRTFYLYPYVKDFKENDFTLSEMSKKSTYCNNICLSKTEQNQESNINLKSKFTKSKILNVESNGNNTNTYVLDENIISPLFKYNN